MGLFGFLRKPKRACDNEKYTVILSVEDFGLQKDPFHEMNRKYFENVDNMDGQQFEVFCANLLQRIGFKNVRVSGKSGDQGVDILADKDGIKYAIQCKCYSSDLGNTPVQEVYAGKTFYNCQIGAVMTNRFFTTGGQQLAENTGILLWDRNWIKERAKLCGMIEEDLFNNITYTDDLFLSAVELVLNTKNADPSFISKKLNIGYARAARLVDEMEKNSIVGPFRGSKPRHILISKDKWNLYMKNTPSG